MPSVPAYLKARSHGLKKSGAGTTDCHEHARIGMSDDRPGIRTTGRPGLETYIGQLAAADVQSRMALACG
jgi:hypothetical protein